MIINLSIKQDNTFNFFCINTENRKRYECIEIKKENDSFLKNKTHFISCSDVFVANIKQINSTQNTKLTAEDKNTLLNKVKKGKIAEKI